MRRKLAAGNWKMNGTSAALTELHFLSQAVESIEVELDSLVNNIQWTLCKATCPCSPSTCSRWR